MTRAARVPAPGPPALPLDTVLAGDCLDVLATLPAASVDCIFADPPYNLQLQHALRRPNMSLVDAVDDDWDQFADFAAYDDFTRAWLGACRRVLKDTGTIWVIGSYHNIYRVGTILLDLGFWILNDILWIKTNPMPNFRGVRFTNAHETLLWCKKSKDQKKYTFNHHQMKSLNDDKQMRSDWEIALCTGAERLKVDGVKAHTAQKPEALLHRVLLSSTRPGDVVLDPFFGTGTTGAVAHRLNRHWIGIEREARYVDLATARIAAIPQPLFANEVFAVENRRTGERIPFGALVEAGLVTAGSALYYARSARSLPPTLPPEERAVLPTATVCADGSLRCGEWTGSIHRIGALLAGQAGCNGWDHWYVADTAGRLQSIDALRAAIRAARAVPSDEPPPVDDTILT